MEALRNNNQREKSGSSSGSTVQDPHGQGLAALMVMLAVLCFIATYCCWGAPCCRAFCRRRCCHCCRSASHDIEAQAADLGLSVDRGVGSTPTIILLPYGRMLVVDGSVFAQLQADSNGLDLIELGENVVRVQQQQQLSTAPNTNSYTGSTPSILDADSENGSKDGCISPVLNGFPPPSYDSIFGSNSTTGLPPSYSEVLDHYQTFIESGETQEQTQESSEHCEEDVRESRV